MKILVTDKQLKLIRESAPKEFSCEKCDHSWEIDKDAEHPYLCHMCGYESSNNEYNYEELEKFWKNYKREDLPAHTDPSKQIVSPSSKVISDICEKEKFCKSQGPITFGQLRKIIESAQKKNLTIDIGEGVYKAVLRLFPWFFPQIAIAGFIGSSVRAFNKIVRPGLEDTTGYKSWWGKTMMRIMDTVEGDLPHEDPISKIFFISDGLLHMMDRKHKLKFTRYIAEVATSKDDSEPVPEFFVENELRNWVNQKFLLDPPLPPKVAGIEETFWNNYKDIISESKKDPFSLSKKHMKSLIDTGKKQMGYSEEQAKEEIESIIQSIKKLPSEIKLFRIIKADDRKDINTKTPGSHYAKNKKDLMSGHSFADGSGDISFMITVLASKELIDIDETIHNNLLYPNENEVTLKNKGEGVKIVSIRKISNQKEVTEKWSEKYKKSINCSNPKGFSQRAHCQGRKKHLKENFENPDKFKKSIENILNKHTSNYEWLDGIEVEFTTMGEFAGWIKWQDEPMCMYTVKINSNLTPSHKEQYELFDDITFVHTLFFPVKDGNPTCYSSAKTQYPNGHMKSFPSFSTIGENIEENDEDIRLETKGYDLNKIKEALLIASKLSTTFGEGIPLEFKLYGYEYKPSEYMMSRMDLYIDVNSKDGVYDTMSEVWHDISNNILDLFSMVGIRDKGYSKPIYDFKFNKRPLYDIIKENIVTESEDDDFKQNGFDIDGIKVSLNAMSQLSETYGEGIPLDFSLHDYYLKQNEGNRRPILQLFIDVNKKDGKEYKITQMYRHEIAVELLNVLEMFGLYNDEKMTPYYNFHFNKRNLE